jgi:SAM-dependent methyltransferase
VTLREQHELEGAEFLAGNIDGFCSEQSIIDVVIRMARDNRHRFKTILDVGCGAYPSYSVELAAMGKQVHGVDFAYNYLSLAKRTATEIRCAQADATQLPYHHQSFDAVVCSETVEHIPDQHGVIAEISRVLKPDGILFFTVPNLWNASRVIQSIKRRDFTVHLFEQHIREYSPSKVKNLLSPWFNIERTYPVGFGWTGKVGGKIEWTISRGLLRRLSKSIAVVAHKR